MPTTNVVIPNMVKGPASATDDAFVKYDGTTGKLLKDGVAGSDGGNGAADGGKVVLFKSTGALEGRCDASFGVKGSSFNGAGILGETTGSGAAVSGLASGTGNAVQAIATGSGDLFRGSNASAEFFEVQNDGTLNWSNATAIANTRKNILPSRTGNALKFLRISSDESDWEAAFVMREVDISVTPTLVLGDGELAFDTAGTGFYLGDGSSTLADLVNGARNWWDVATTVGSFLQIANDLSDLNDAATARTNLGLGDLAELNAVDTSEIEDDAVTADKLADTAVTPGSYTNADITVDAQGRITAASNGSAGSGVPFLLQFDSAAAPIQRVDNDSITIKAGDAYVNGTALSWSDTALNGTAGTAPLDTAGTIYVYLYDSGGATAAFEFSKTAPTWDPTNGYQTKGGDADYMLIAALPVWDDGGTEKIGGFTTNWANGRMRTSFCGAAGSTTQFAPTLSAAVSGGNSTSVVSATFANGLVPDIADRVLVRSFVNMATFGSSGRARVSVGVNGSSFNNSNIEVDAEHCQKVWFSNNETAASSVIPSEQSWVNIQTANTIYYVYFETSGTATVTIWAKAYEYRLTR